MYNRENYEEWLKSLKVGDEVAIPQHSGWSNMIPPYKIVQIDRETSSCWGVRNELYYKENGNQRGDKFKSIRPVTSDVLESIALANTTRKCHESFSDLEKNFKRCRDLDTLMKVLTKLEELEEIFNEKTPSKESR